MQHCQLLARMILKSWYMLLSLKHNGPLGTKKNVTLVKTLIHGENPNTERLNS
jgi:hypothetical protein